MSQMKLDPITQRVPLDPVALGLELLHIQTVPAEPFGSHLQRATTSHVDVPVRDTTDRRPKDRTSADRASTTTPDERARHAESESHAANDTDVPDHADAPDGQVQEPSPRQDVSESTQEEPSTEEHDGTESARQTETADGERTSDEDAVETDDKDAEEVDVAIGAGKAQTDVPVKTDAEASEGDENESKLGAETDGEETADKNPKQTGTLEEQKNETHIANVAVAGEKGSEQEGSKEGADGKTQKASVGNDTTAVGSQDQSDAESDSSGERVKQDIVSAEELAEETASQSETSARQQQIDAQDAGTEVATKSVRQTDAETPNDEDRRSARREKKTMKEAARKGRIADPGSQQQAAEEPAKVAVDLKPATVEPTVPVVTPQPETANEAVKPVSGSADGQSGGTITIRADSGRPGRAAAALRAPANADESQGSDQARFVGRVARAFEAMGNRNGPVRLKLSPPELGSLKIEISVRGSTMTARVEAETSTAKNLLLDNLPALRDRLNGQGIKIDQFDVDLADRQPGGLPDQRPDHADSRDRREGNRASHAGREETERDEDDRPSHRTVRPGVDGQLNVIV